MLWRLQKLIKITIYEMFDSEISEEKTPAFFHINKLTIFHSIYYFFFLKEKRKVKTEWYSFLCCIYTFNILTFFSAYFHFILIRLFGETKTVYEKKSKFFFFNTNKTFFISDGNTYYWKYYKKKFLTYYMSKLWIK